MNHVLNLDFVGQQAIDYAIVADNDLSNVLSLELRDNAP